MSIDRRFVGRTYPSYTYDVCKEKIKEYARAVKQLKAATDKINADYGLKENRDLIHQEAIEAAGLTENEMILSGGKPKNALSDMDVTAKTYAAGKAYTKALAGKGLKVTEFSDRWVVSNDTTIWKPASGDSVGASSYEAQLIHGASEGSDKFATQSGQNFTKGQETGDKLGAVFLRQFLLPGERHWAALPAFSHLPANAVNPLQGGRFPLLLLLSNLALAHQL